MAKQGESKLWAFLAIFLGIIGFLIIFLAKKEDKYAMYYAKQSLVLFIVAVAAFIIGMIPLLGWVIAPILTLIVFILWIIGLVYSVSGQMKPIPLVGKYADKLNI